MGQQTILYIEDDPASRRLVERVLQHSGYEIVTAETGLKGIDIARKLLPDLIITDIDLPDLRGQEIATALRADARFTHIPIVALTAMTYGEHREMAMAAGLDGYMIKPLNTAKLREQVKYYLEGGRDDIDPESLSAGQARFTREIVARLEQRIRQLEDANAALVRLDRMKENFIQITAHELRTPLTLVYGYVRLLEDFPSLKGLMQQDESVKGLIQGLVDAIERMHGVVNEILTTSRIMARQIELNISGFKLGELMERVIEEYMPDLEERDLTLKFDPTEWHADIRADRELIRLVVSNLLSNAMKYTPDGGEITIGVQEFKRRVTFFVRDTGIGIDPKQQLYIFDNFHTVADSSMHSSSKTAFEGGGLGLGLPICKGIIEVHGGEIRVESVGYDPENCPGSTFIVTLPLVALH